MGVPNVSGNDGVWSSTREQNTTAPSDGTFLIGVTSSVEQAIGESSRSLRNGPAGSFLKSQEMFTRAKFGDSMAGTLSKYTPLLNVGVAAVDIFEAAKYDKEVGNENYDETILSASSSAGNILLSGAATVAAVGLGIGALPAAALIIGGAYAGSAIGKEVGEFGLGVYDWFKAE